MISCNYYDEYHRVTLSAIFSNKLKKLALKQPKKFRLNLVITFSAKLEQKVIILNSLKLIF